MTENPAPNRTALITGANRGIGLEFVRQYIAEKWNIIACCREPTKADQLRFLAQTHPSTLRIETLDVTDDKDIAVLAAKLKDMPIDLLINAAGIFSGTGIDGKHFFDEQDADKTQTFGTIDANGWAKVLRTNTIAPVMMTQAFQKNLARNKGSIVVMISSRYGSIARITEADTIAYRSSKAALNAAMKSISISLKEQGTIVSCLHPGWVRTDMGGKGADITPEKSVMQMRRVISLLKQEGTGQFLNYDGQQIPW